MVAMLALVIGVCAGFAACGEGTSSTDWSKYTQDQWIDEIDKFDGKEISYQFLGTLEAERSADVVLNLYKDGSLCVGAYHGADSQNHYVGYWNDDNGLAFKIVAGYGQGMSGMTYAAKDTDYTATEASGTYTVTINIDLAMGQFTRQVELTGSTTVEYATLQAFYDAQA